MDDKIASPEICGFLNFFGSISYIAGIVAAFAIPQTMKVCTSLCSYEYSAEYVVTSHGIALGISAMISSIIFGLVLHGLSNIIDSLNAIKHNTIVAKNLSAQQEITETEANG